MGSEGKEVVANADRQSLRSIFHLLVGKPDSSYKMFSKHVYLEEKHITLLDERVGEKLRTHHVEAMVASAVVVFDDKTVIEFGGIPELKDYRWDSGKITKEIRLSWKFLLKVQGYEMPQQHALTVKISSSAKPLEVLQTMFSKDPDEVDGAEFRFSPISCRVDFINHAIGEELIAVVGRWLDSLPVPESKEGVSKFLDDKKDIIAPVIHYSTPIFFSLLCLAYLKNLHISSAYEDNLTVGGAVDIASWGLVSMLGFFLILKISHSIAVYSYNLISNHGNYSIFNLTSGDKNRDVSIKAKNKSMFRKYLIANGFSFLMNILAGIFIIEYWPL